MVKIFTAVWFCMVISARRVQLFETITLGYKEVKQEDAKQK